MCRGKAICCGQVPDEDAGDTVAVVHQKCINGDWCYWPNAKSSKMINMLSERGANPSKDWKRVLCIPIESFQSFEKARRKLKTAEDTSDLQSETDLGKGKRKRKATRISDSSDSDVPQRRRRQPMPLAGCNAMDDEGSSGPPTPPPAATLRALKQSSTTFSSIPACRNVATKTVSKELEPEGLRRHTLEALHMIRLMLDNLTALMGTVLEALNKHTEEDDDDDCPFQEPHASYDSFMEFECQLQASEAMRKKLVHWFAGLGGKTVGATTRRLLEALMTQNVAVNFSWKGQKGKAKFQQLQCVELIYQAVKRNPRITTTRHDIEEVIKTWLRHAAEKLRKLEESGLGNIP
ncbi:uncharacterized protein LOC120840882 [Ixodes scapularis]|uniref:uncharacterized protein LOC120840882 n=1 Tax=Ixodes scapularis TaxID=6945 RepID=UPI001C388C41|nr:uncharacterized protein LOC120840882 [Ixodes scapularis]